MQVKYFGRMANGNGNLLWDKKFPMKGGKFPFDHPVGNGKSGNCQFGRSAGIDALRERGYWVSCFPEGDGLCFDPPDKKHEDIIKDIRDCFGWDVVVVRI